MIKYYTVIKSFIMFLHFFGDISLKSSKKYGIVNMGVLLKLCSLLTAIFFRYPTKILNFFKVSEENLKKYSIFLSDTFIKFNIFVRYLKKLPPTYRYQAVNKLYGFIDMDKTTIPLQKHRTKISHENRKFSIK